MPHYVYILYSNSSDRYYVGSAWCRSTKKKFSKFIWLKADFKVSDMNNIFRKIDKRKFYERMGGYSFLFMLGIGAFGVMTGQIRWHVEWFYAAWLAYFFLYFGLAWIAGIKIKSQGVQFLAIYIYLISGGIFLLW